MFVITTKALVVDGIALETAAYLCLTVAVSKLHLYEFKKDEDVSVENSTVTFCAEGSPLSFLSNLLMGMWEERMRRGLFRYDVTICETKVIPGKYGFIAQLNEGRHLKKRPTEFRVDQVLQPFDESKFNFTKVGQEEVLFRFEPGDIDKSHFFPCSPVDVDTNSPNVVAINVSPIEYGHVLLIPHVLDHLPQRIDHESFFLALHLAKEAADPFFRIGYNSLGAFATINHLHFQAYYLSVCFPIEKAPTRIVMTGKGLHDRRVMVSQLLNYPVRGLVFEGGNSARDLSDAVASSCICLQTHNIAFNVLISDCGKRIYLFPQFRDSSLIITPSCSHLAYAPLKNLNHIPSSLIINILAINFKKSHLAECYAEKQALGQVSQELLDTQVNPAVWEISGHMVLKRRKDYEEASEESAWRLLAEVAVSEQRFQEVKALISESAGLQDGLEGNGMDGEEDIHKPLANQVPSCFHKDCLVLQ
ncbi:hypothetical protein RJ640_010938 [Escallonia rubra]|uniref:GDP-D-glucose phosphorylase 1 n=1 Tax=Escallonia rubra TaxID=112253 RepID=A0AA88UMD7_9ASTE|nr:hypothetical protein RJ640_010938 [Escallonia rubra]